MPIPSLPATPSRRLASSMERPAYSWRRLAVETAALLLFITLAAAFI